MIDWLRQELPFADAMLLMIAANTLLISAGVWAIFGHLRSKE